jgi:dTDP-glucose 4,6-dehydratase
LPVYGDGAQVRDWLYVGDHCRAIRAVLARGRLGEVYNIGGDSEKQNLEVVQTICKAVDTLRPGLPHAPCTSLISFVKDRPGHDRRYAIDFGKIESELGWRPSLSFDEAISRTVAWYLDNGPWIKNIASGGSMRVCSGLLDRTA